MVYFVSASTACPLGYIFCRTVTAEIDNWLSTFDFCIVEGTLPSPRAPWLPKGPPPSLCRYIQVEGANIRMDIEGATIHMDIEGAKILMDTELSDPRSLMVWYSFDALSSASGQQRWEQTVFLKSSFTTLLLVAPFLEGCVPLIQHTLC